MRRLPRWRHVSTTVACGIRCSTTQTHTEASATAGFCHGILKAVRKRYVAAEYAEVAEKAIRGIVKNISPEGELLQTSFEPMGERSGVLPPDPADVDAVRSGNGNPLFDGVFAEVLDHKNPAMIAGFFCIHTFYGFDTRGIQTQLSGLRRQLRQLQAAVADRFIFRRQNRAVLVEAGEQTGQIAGKHISVAYRRVQPRTAFFKLQQTAASWASRSSVMVTVTCQHAFIDIRFTGTPPRARGCRHTACTARCYLPNASMSQSKI